MKKQIENIKRNWKDDSKKAACVIIGFISGQALAKGIDYLAAKYPQLEPMRQYGTPIVIGGGGWLISAASSNEQEALKFFGYGLQASGAYEGIKLFPIAKDMLRGVDETIGSTYYMENEKPILELGDFGVKALPVKSIDMERAPEIKLGLPELEGAETERTDEPTVNIDLGYTNDVFDGLV